MLKSLLVSILIVVTPFAYNSSLILAQKVSFSAPIDIHNNDSYKILGEYDGTVLLFFDARKEFRVIGIDESLNVKWEEVLNIDAKEYRITGILAQDTSFSIFLSSFNRDSSFLYELEYDARAKLKSEKVIDRSERKNRLGPYLFTHSEDRSQVVFVQTNRNNHIRVISYNCHRHEPNYVEEILFDEDIGESFRFIDISDRGDAVLILDRDNTKFRLGKHRTELLYVKGEEQTVVHRMDYPDKLFTDLNSVIDNRNNAVYISGFYSMNSYTESDGYFVTKLDLTAAQYNTMYKPWDIDLLSEIYGNDKKNNRTVSNLELVDIQLYEDGGTLLLCEEQKVLQRRNSLSNSRGFSTSDYVDYYYEDIILLSDKDNAEESWSKVIRKRQFSQDDAAVFSSFFVFKVPSYIQVMFNDEISSNSIVNGFLINGNGQMKRTSVLSTDFHNLRLKMRDAVQLSSTSILIPSEYRSKLRLVHVEY